MFKIVSKLFFCSSVLLTFATTASAQHPQGERPELRIGDSWEYSYRNTNYGNPGCNYSLTVENVTTNRIRGKVLHPEGCDLNLSGKVLTYDKDFNVFISRETALRAFSFPLEVGKTWSQDYRTTGNDSYINNVTATVTAVEKVTVPAGTFDTFKIVLNRKYIGSRPGKQDWTGTVEDTYWYSPVAKNYVKRTFYDRGQGSSPSLILRELQKYNLQ